MPTSPPRCCPCGGKRTNGVCDRCGPRKRSRVSDENRGTRTQRGYDNRWLRLRAAFLAEHPLCADCEANGMVTPAEQVHHVAKVADRPDLRLDWENLMALCAGCHSRRTARGE